MRSTYAKPVVRFAMPLFLLLASTMPVQSAGVFTADDVFEVKRPGEARISPDGKWIAYTVRRVRDREEKAGFDYRELFVVPAKGGDARPFVTGKVSVRSPRWSPDGSYVAFAMKRGEEKAKTQVWVIPSDGGEAVQVTDSKSGVTTFRWHPDGKHIAYTATTPPNAREKKLKKKGYGFIYYEENLKHRNLYTVAVDPSGPPAKAEQLTRDITIWTFEFNHDGSAIAAGASEKNLIDRRTSVRRSSRSAAKGPNARCAGPASPNTIPIPARSSSAHAGGWGSAKPPRSA